MQAEEKVRRWLGSVPVFQNSDALWSHHCYPGVCSSSSSLAPHLDDFQDVVEMQARKVTQLTKMAYRWDPSETVVEGSCGVLAETLFDDKCAVEDWDYDNATV